MLDSPLLNTVIGLSLIFLLYSLFVSALQEAVTTFRQRRARMLFRAIRTMLSNTPDRELPVFFLLLDKTFVGRIWDKSIRESLEKKKENNDTNFTPKEKRYLLKLDRKNSSVCLHKHIYGHPIIKNFGQNDFFSRPSYMTDRTFSEILIDVVKDLDQQNTGKAASFATVKLALENNVEKLETEVVKILQFHLNEAAGDLNAFKYRLEKWFNETMDRVSGWYKRTTQFWLFAIGIVLAVGFNVDTIEISRKLSKDKKAAEQLAEIGKSIAGNPNYSGRDTSLQEEIIDSIKVQLNTVNSILALGWEDYALIDSAYKKRILKNKKYNKEFDSSGLKAVRSYQDGLNALNRELKVDSTKRETIEKRIARYRIDSTNYVAKEQIKLFFEDNGWLKFRYVFYSLTHDPLKILGFLITAVALSLGAPFWFDLLNKFVNIKGSGKAVSSSSGKAGTSQIDG